MRIKVQPWDVNTAQRELSQRLQACRKGRQKFESQWEENERVVYSTRAFQSNSELSVSFSSDSELGISPVDSSASDSQVNYIMKDIRFIHSQMSANPPTVVPRPATPDAEDRRRADAADRVVRFGVRAYDMQEKTDIATLNTLVYGTAFGKTIWNPNLGDIMEMNEQTDEVLLEGDFDYTVPSTWDIFPDTDARTWREVRYVFERFIMPYEEACALFPGKKELLERIRIKGEKPQRGQGGYSAVEQSYNDVIECYQYWERGLPQNGMVGRFVWCASSGELLSEVEPNPFRFSATRQTQGDAEKQLFKRAELPFHLITDIDIPGTYWGQSTVSYASALQALLNRIDNVTVDNLQAHGVARIILPEGAEIADDSITNSPWDVIKYTGNIPPSFMEPMAMPAVLPQVREVMRAGINDMNGTNDSMFGQVKRESSGFSLQYATNQGNMIRRRLFNKYVKFVESVYRAYLNIAKENWTVSRTISVLGKEKAFESMDIKGSDLSSGFDIVVEYGASLSLDPTTRREEIMTLMPLFEKAGVDTRTILGFLKLNELEGMYDRLQLAGDRQREAFEEMIATQVYQHPQEMQDHKNMLEYAYNFVMTTEYKYLEDMNKQLIIKHIKERELLAQGANPQNAQAALGGAAPGGMPPQGLPGPAAPAGVENMGALMGQGQPLKQ